MYSLRISTYFIYLISTYNHELFAKLEYKGESHTLFANCCTPVSYSNKRGYQMSKGAFGARWLTYEFIPMWFISWNNSFFIIRLLKNIMYSNIILLVWRVSFRVFIFSTPSVMFKMIEIYWELYDLKASWYHFYKRN